MFKEGDAVNLSQLIGRMVNFLQKHIWLLSIFFYLQGTVYYVEYLKVLRVDPDYYPLTFEQVLSYSVTIYMQEPFLTGLLLLFCFGISACLLTDRVMNWVRNKFNKVLKKQKRKENIVRDIDLITPLENIQPNSVQKGGLQVAIIVYSVLAFLITAILPAGVVGHIDAKELLEDAKSQIESMSKNEGLNDGKIQIKCKSFHDTFSGPYFSLKNSTQYHSLFNGVHTITIPSSCIEFTSERHESVKALNNGSSKVAGS